MATKCIGNIFYSFIVNHWTCHHEEKLQISYDKKMDKLMKLQIYNKCTGVQFKALFSLK